MNESSIGRLVQGAAACACWLRMTNLHSLTTSAATVLSHHIGLLIRATQRGANQFNLNGMDTPLNLKCTFIGTECIGCDFNSSKFAAPLREAFHATGVVTADPFRITELLLTSRGIANSVSLIDRMRHVLDSQIRKPSEIATVGYITHSSVFHFFKNILSNTEKQQVNVGLYVESAVLALESGMADKCV